MAALAGPLNAAIPEIPQQAHRDIDFVPWGWDLFDKVQGDLNGDGREDSILVIQANDPNKQIENPDGFGVDRYDENQRILLFILSDDDGFLWLAGRDDWVIPDHDSPTMDDPYAGIEINDDKASLTIRFWANAGSWFVLVNRFHFRWDGHEMEVIGYDGVEFHRASHESREVSINYVNGQRKDVTIPARDRAEEQEPEPQESWSKIAPGSQPKLGAIGNGFEFLPLSP